jgi:chromosome segregation ATPase
VTQTKRDWRGKREFNRRRDALTRIIDSPDTKAQDVFRALEMLDAWVGIPDLKAEITRLQSEGERLAGEVERLQGENAELRAEVARLRADVQETETALEQALG